MSKQPDSVRRQLATGRSISCNDDDDFVECVSDSRPAMTKSSSLVSSESGCIARHDSGFQREETLTDSENHESGPDGEGNEHADDDCELNDLDDGTDTGISPQSSSRKARAEWIVLGTYSKKMASLALKQTIERIFSEEMRTASADIIYSDDFSDYKLCKKLGNFVRSNVRCCQFFSELCSIQYEFLQHW